MTSEKTTFLCRIELYEIIEDLDFHSLTKNIVREKIYSIVKDGADLSSYS